MIHTLKYGGNCSTITIECCASSLTLEFSTIAASTLNISKWIVKFSRFMHHTVYSYIVFFVFVWVYVFITELKSRYCIRRFHFMYALIIIHQSSMLARGKNDYFVFFSCWCRSFFDLPLRFRMFSFPFRIFGIGRAIFPSSYFKYFVVCWF